MRSAIDYKKINTKGYKTPLIIPIVLYTGRKKWDAKTYIREAQEKLKGYEELEFARYNLIDVNEYSKEELLKEESFISKVMLLEKTKNNEFLVHYLEEVVKEINKNNKVYTKESKELLITMIDLILRKKIGEKKAKELIEILKGGNKDMLAVLEMIEEDNKRIRREGIKEGIKINKLEVAKKLISKKLTLKEIEEITGLDEKELKKMM